MRRVRQGSSLTWLNMRIGLQGRKPRESNKLFDLYYRHRTLSVQSVKSVVKEEKLSVAEKGNTLVMEIFL